MVCIHEYNILSVGTSNFVVFEKCSDRGKTRRHDGTKLTVEQSDTMYTAAAYFSSRL